MPLLCCGLTRSQYTQNCLTQRCSAATKHKLQPASSTTCTRMSASKLATGLPPPSVSVRPDRVCTPGASGMSLIGSEALACGASSTRTASCSPCTRNGGGAVPARKHRQDSSPAPCQQSHAVSRNSVMSAAHMRRQLVKSRVLRTLHQSSSSAVPATRNMSIHRPTQHRKQCTAQHSLPPYPLCFLEQYSSSTLSLRCNAKQYEPDTVWRQLSTT